MPDPFANMQPSVLNTKGRYRDLRPTHKRRDADTSKNKRASDGFDWDRALSGFKRVLAEVYGE